METVIKKISEIEIAAKKIMENASSETVALKKQMEDKAVAFDAQVKEDTDKKLDLLRKDLDNKTKDALASLKSDTAKSLDDLNKYYENNHNELSEAIYRKIIGK